MPDAAPYNYGMRTDMHMDTEGQTHDFSLEEGGIWLTSDTSSGPYRSSSGIRGVDRLQSYRLLPIVN